MLKFLLLLGVGTAGASSATEILDLIKQTEALLAKSREKLSSQETARVQAEEESAALREQISQLQQQVSEWQEKAQSVASAAPEAGRCAGEPQDTDRYRVEVLSDRPRAFYFPHLLTHEECDAIVAAGSAFLAPSQVDAGHDARIRSSYVHFFSAEQEVNSPAIASVKQRAFNISQLPKDHGEGLQLQRYKAKLSASRKDFYEPHFDSMGGQDSRVATWIFYLSDVEQGGETFFPTVPSSGKARPAFSAYEQEAMLDKAKRDFADICEGKKDALMVKPKKGAALLFYTLTPSGALDPNSVHGSCPVLKGTKFIAQQWIRQQWWLPYYDPRLVQHSRVPLPAARSGTSKCFTNADTAIADLRSSRASTLAFWIKLDNCNSEGTMGVSAVREGTGKRVSFAVHIRKGCIVASVSPARHNSQEQQTAAHIRLKRKIQPRNWVHIALIVENRDFDVSPLGAGPHSKWSYTQWMLVDGKDPNSFEGVFDSADLDWGSTQMCVKNKQGVQIRGLFLFSRQLDSRDLEHLIMVSNQDDVQAS
mmetsp:Transcript_40066/g.78772  ORF Transcript_40066/g.78772 Transcript_40066/m.78772 type:complete len:535 (-) Transcript_40066:117-1721(-)|eukprot:CAMPEP_0175130804 /NCGR_PEP_ID=MMETSP0087-20121206/6197_1 /TAXON_ID=136419 /ORGANISM="Unknown Unknown, Strain D1" /LENGTH=534 /DNA_ID=CAMNT_0016413037 /DNA_START=38 /DNA_END=1642 /DNA_ORIENTATION=+